MKIGVFATFMSPVATPDMIAEFGRRAEGAGIDSLWLGEHVGRGCRGSADRHGLWHRG